MSKPRSWIADKQNEQRFQTYKRAIQTYDDARADRTAVGDTPTDLTSERPAACEQADVALAQARRLLDGARTEYLRGSGPAADRSRVALVLDNGRPIGE
jgi:hypothetical protein